MKRIILHWSAGGHTASAVDLRHYHYVIQGDGSVVQGDKLPEANLNTGDGDYAAHTRALNTGSIGVAFAAMHDAKERPFDPGPFPITEAQMQAMAGLCADLCDGYGIEVSRRTVLTHAEVQPTLGVAQRGKWDISWVPGMDKPGDPVFVGDRIRALISEKLHAPAVPIQTKGGVPDPVRRTIEDADKPKWSSKAVLTSLAGIGTNFYLFWQTADTETRAAIGVLTVLFVFLFYDRIRKANLGKLAREALGG